MNYCNMNATYLVNLLQMNQDLLNFNIFEIIFIQKYSNCSKFKVLLGLHLSLQFLYSFTPRYHIILTILSLHFL